MAGRAALIAVVAVGLALVHLPGRPATLCVLRAVTGVPCPFCGGTTAMVHLGRADLSGALRASPLAVLGAPFVVALPALRRHLDRLGRRQQLLAVLCVLAASEVWQLARVWPR